MYIYVYVYRQIINTYPNPEPCSESGAAGSQWRRYRHPWAHRRSSAFTRGCPPDPFQLSCVAGLNTGAKGRQEKRMPHFGISGPSPGLLGACRKQGIEVWCWRPSVAELMRLRGAQSKASASFGQHVRIRVAAEVSSVVLPGLICVTGGNARMYNA